MPSAPLPARPGVRTVVTLGSFRLQVPDDVTISVKARPLAGNMPDHSSVVHEMAHLHPPPQHEHVADESAMTAPPDGFRAHDRRDPKIVISHEFRHGRAEFVTSGPPGIRPEGLDPPPAIR